MKMSEVQKLLSKNGIDYSISTEMSRAEFYRRKGFCPTEDTEAFRLLTITNPNHTKEIEIIFTDASDDPEFYDLEFGGYWYEMFGCIEAELPQSLIDEIQSILCGRAWVIFATDAKTGKWFFTGLYCDTIEEEWNDMERLHKTLAKIKKPKSLWRKFIGRTDVYEIFNWQNYERVIK